MSQQNRISATLTPEQKLSIQTDLNNIKSVLSGILIHSLTPDERQTMVKMGDKSVAFVQKSLEFATSNPPLVPSFLDVDEAKRDLQLSLDLQSILFQFVALTTAMEDAMMISGSEAYNGALIFYKSMQAAVRSNVPGSQFIVDELKQRFPRKGGNGDTPITSAKI